MVLRHWQVTSWNRGWHMQRPLYKEDILQDFLKDTYTEKRFPAHFIYLRKQAFRPSLDRSSLFSLVIFDLRYRLLAAQPLVRTVPSQVE